MCFSTTHCDCTDVFGLSLPPFLSSSVCPFSHTHTRWMKDLFRLGLKRPIEISDIYQNLSAHDSARLATRFDKLWSEEKKTSRPRIFTVIAKLYWVQIISLSIGFAAVDIISRWVRLYC